MSQQVCVVISPRGTIIGAGAHGFSEAIQQARTESREMSQIMDEMLAIWTQDIYLKAHQVTHPSGTTFRMWPPDK